MFQKASFLATVHGAKIHSFSHRERLLFFKKNRLIELQDKRRCFKHLTGIFLNESLFFLCYQLDGNGDGEPGVLMTAQTITSESLCTTTTTHITKVQADAPIQTHMSMSCVFMTSNDLALLWDNPPDSCTNTFAHIEVRSLQVTMATIHTVSWYDRHQVIAVVYLFQTLKGGLSETRIEKRIVITGDCDIDHDQVSVQSHS